MLWSYLNSHPAILCMRSLFGPESKVNFGSHYPGLFPEDRSPELVVLRNSRPIEFIETHVFKQYLLPYSAVGFKYFYNDDRHLDRPDAIRELFLNSNCLRFLHLKRRDLLSTLFSHLRARDTGNWTSADPAYKTVIPSAVCMAYFEQVIISRRTYDDLLMHRCMDVWYEDLLAEPDRVLEHTMNFISVKPTMLKCEVRANSPVDLTRSILNYHELKERFKGTTHELYFRA